MATAITNLPKKLRARSTNRSWLPPGIDGCSPTARRYRDLMAGFTTALGGELNEAQRIAVQRAAGLLVAAEELRLKAMRGERVSIAALVKLENLASRAVRLLDLPLGGEPKRPTLRERIAVGIGIP